MKTRIRNFVATLVMCLLLAPLSLSAASSTAEMDQFPNVTLSPDGSKRAWTTDLWDKTNERLPWEYTVDMHAESSISELNVGEHYYKKEATGSVTVGKWVVMHSPGQCIHDTPTKDTFAGFDYRNEICYSYYNNGWFAYCADCGEVIAHMLIYARESTVKQITSMPASATYVYLCPHCTHLEQGYSYQHICIGISNNRYKVTYRPNQPNDSIVYGYMSPTRHMYGNSSIYNGQSASELGYADTALRKNSFSCEGYLFAGWNTKADGSGQAFTDGQEVINLTTEDNGTVKLYAQWVKTQSTLQLDANGGTYNGKSVYTQTQKYGTSYTVKDSLITPPAGYKVNFVTNGGGSISPITTTKSFAYWEMVTGFAGNFKSNVYSYSGANGTVDTLKAWYVNDSFILPDCTGTNASLVGWYDAPSLSEEHFIGKAGDEVTVNKDTTLYAKWATLTLWAYDDYDSHGGVGAADLKWEQKDGKSKYYRLYQSMDQNTWSEIFSGSDIGNTISIHENYGTDSQGTTYTISYTGNYTLTANGAKGADYSAIYKGGAGGSVSATYWLLKGDVLTFYAGTAGNGTSGGSNGNGANGGNSSADTGRGGGGATEVYLTRNGSKIPLLIAGGGGGANAYTSGESGGSKQTSINTQSGSDSAYGGGGGGAQGGSAGEHITHTHQGTSAYGGGCYGEPVVHYCSDSCYEISEEYGWFVDEYWDGDDYISEWCCAVCGSASGEYHFHSTTNPDGSVTVHCSGVGEPGYICCTEEKEEHICGYTNGQTLYYKLSCQYKDFESGAIISSKAALGGSNYINNDYGCKNSSSNAGSNPGNGSISVFSLDVGYIETNSIADVLAMDKAAPGLITAYDTGMSGEARYRVKVTEPLDYGTVYYHKAESYEEGSITKLATSNITTNTLISGIKGYRYYVDTNENGTVAGSHAWTNERIVDVTLNEQVQYLHMAAVDVAGNIGPTLHIYIPKAGDTGEEELEDDYFKAVPLKTDMLILNDTEYVYEASPGTYFIKADGETEHALFISGYVAGKATNNYQPDWLRLVSTAEVIEWYQAQIPRLRVDAEDKIFGNEELMTDASSEDFLLLTPISAVAKRTVQAENVKMEQMITIDAANDGKKIYVYPRVMAEYEEKEYWSDEAADKSHGLTLIPDAVAPVINGIESLENAGNIDMTEESRDFVITAVDSGSGVRSLIITITNLDNRMQRTYSSGTGSLTITTKKDDYLFLGDFVVTAEASDNVSNVNTKGSDKLAFTLEAELQRARYPHDGNFKAGDGAVLIITTGGYADKVIIRFPDELLALNSALNKEYVYEYPEAIKTEVYEFNIPLATPNGSYTIEVEAWKNGRKLTEKLELLVCTIGSIIEEFRTRIRDNGVW